MTGAGRRAELPGDGPCVLLDRCLAHLHVGEVAVLQQVDGLDQLARAPPG